MAPLPLMTTRLPPSSSRLPCCDLRTECCRVRRGCRAASAVRRARPRCWLCGPRGRARDIRRPVRVRRGRGCVAPPLARCGPVDPTLVPRRALRSTPHHVPLAYPCLCLLPCAADKLLAELEEGADAVAVEETRMRGGGGASAGGSGKKVRRVGARSWQCRNTPRTCTCRRACVRARTASHHTIPTPPLTHTRAHAHVFMHHINSAPLSLRRAGRPRPPRGGRTP